MNVLQTQTDLQSQTAAAAASGTMTGGLGAFGVGQPSVTLTIRLIMQGKVSFVTFFLFFYIYFCLFVSRIINFLQYK